MMKKIFLAFGCLLAIGAAQAQTINNLGTGTTLGGTEQIPMYQGSNPAVTTTPAAIKTYMGLGTAAAANTGTSGGTIGMLNTANTWSATQTMSGLTLSSITGSTQCLQVSNTGVVSGTSAPCGGSGSTGANPIATAGPTAVNGSATTFLRSDGAPAIQLGTSSQKGIVQVDGTSITASSGVISAVGAVSSVTGAVGVTVSPTTGSVVVSSPATQRNNTATTDNLLSTDSGTIVTESNASPVAVGIAAATTPGFGVGNYWGFKNKGAGLVTITPTTSTIDGAATLTLSQYQSVDIVSDGTNYFTLRGLSSGSGGSGANPTATAGPAAVNGSATTFLRSDGAPAIQLATSSQKGIVQVDGTTLSATAGIASVIANCGVSAGAGGVEANITARNTTATTDTIASTDCGTLVTENNASPVAVALPQAGTTGFLTGFYYTQKNKGAGTVTITPTTSTIDGASTLTLSQYQSTDIYSDGTNYWTLPGRSTGGSGSGANPTATAGPAAVNGSATTFLRSDGAPAIQLATSSQKGIVQVDGTTITASSGVISAVGAVASVTGGVGVTASPTTGAVVVSTAVTARNNTATTDTLVSGDAGTVVTESNASPVAVGIAVATTSGFGTGNYWTVKNKGAGLVTITPTTSTIGGNATVTIGSGASLDFYSDGTNYQTLPGNGTGVSCTGTPTSSFATINGIVTHC